MSIFRLLIHINTKHNNKSVDRIFTQEITILENYFYAKKLFKEACEEVTLMVKAHAGTFGKVRLFRATVDENGLVIDEPMDNTKYPPYYFQI